MCQAERANLPKLGGRLASTLEKDAVPVALQDTVCTNFPKNGPQKALPMCWPEAIFSRQWRLVESWFHRLCHAGCEELHPRTGLQSFIGFAAALGGKRLVRFGSIGHFK